MRPLWTRTTLSAALALALAAAAPAAQKPRARDLGVPFDGTPGPLDAITDVKGVEVGETTLISGSGKLVVGQGPVRTGVTVVLPRGKSSDAPCFGAWFTLNGTGEMTGTTYVEESGLLEGPVSLTNSQSVGTVRDAIGAWLTGVKHWPLCCLPVVAETFDGDLNDINGFHVRAEHVVHAIDTASGGPVPEGNVGGGTGMIAFGFKGGTGTASRTLTAKDGGYTVGVLVQANFGSRRNLRIAGVPVGAEMTGDLPELGALRRPDADAGSIIVVVATDAPLLPHQLKRLARRAALGIARAGGIGGDGSGDIFVAFSTANDGLVGIQTGKETSITNVTMLPNDHMDPLFEATIEATEESIDNALVAAETMEGIDGHRVVALPHDRLREILAKYGRLARAR